MSILTVPSRPTLTKAQNQRKAKAKILGSMNMLFGQLLRAYTDNMDVIWSNSDGLTAQEVFDALGTDAADAVRLTELLKSTINQANPGTLTDKAPNSLTKNSDGTVKLGVASK